MPTSLPHALALTVLLIGGLVPGLLAGVGFDLGLGLGRALMPLTRSRSGRPQMWDRSLLRHLRSIGRICGLGFALAAVALFRRDPTVALIGLNGALADLRLGLDPFTGSRYAFGGGNPISANAGESLARIYPGGRMPARVRSTSALCDHGLEAPRGRGDGPQGQAASFLTGPCGLLFRTAGQ